MRQGENTHGLPEAMWKKSRIDYFLISEELMALIGNSNIFPGYRTDDSLLELSISITYLKKGRVLGNSIIHCYRIRY